MKKINIKKTKYVCQKCGYTETLDTAQLCPYCSRDFMGPGRIGFEMKPVDDENY